MSETRTHEISTFTVSDLKEIKDISHDDLLMVSDVDHTDSTCYTRKMTLSSLFNQIADDTIISNAILDNTKGMGYAINQKMIQDISREVTRQLETDLSIKVLAIISANYNTVNDLLDGTLDNQQIIDASRN